MTNKKKIRITLNAPVVIGMVGISLFATLCNYITSGTSNRVLFMTYHSALLSPMTWVRAFTHIFGHADWEHFISNMSYILLLGPMLEEKYTSKTLTGVIAITAFGTSLVNYVFSPLWPYVEQAALYLRLSCYLLLLDLRMGKFQLLLYWWRYSLLVSKYGMVLQCRITYPIWRILLAA